MMACPCTPASASRSISSSTAWRVGRAAETVALNGNLPSGARAEGLMPMAVTMRRDRPGPLCPPAWRTRCRAGREEGRGIERAGLQGRPCRSGSTLSARARRARSGARRSHGGRAPRRDRAPVDAADMHQRSAFGSSRWRTSSTRAAPSPAAEVTALKPNPSAVAAVVSPTARIGRPRCSLASASARAPLALVSRTAWQAARDAEKSVGG